MFGRLTGGGLGRLAFHADSSSPSRDKASRRRRAAAAPPPLAPPPLAPPRRGCYTRAASRPATAAPRQGASGSAPQLAPQWAPSSATQAGVLLYFRQPAAGRGASAHACSSLGARVGARVGQPVRGCSSHSAPVWVAQQSSSAGGVEPAVGAVEPAVGARGRTQLAQLPTGRWRRAGLDGRIGCAGRGVSHCAQHMLGTQGGAAHRGMSAACGSSTVHAQHHEQHASWSWAHAPLRIVH